MSDPALSQQITQMHGDLAGRLELDKRLRVVEVGQAKQDAEISSLAAEQRQTRAEVLAAIAELKPGRTTWPQVVSALIAAAALLIAIVKSIPAPPV